MELQPGGVCLDVPVKTGAMGHTLKLTFEVRGAKLPFTFTAKGVVKKAASLGEGREKFEIEFVEVETSYFEALRSLFDQRQSEIDRFMAEVKG